VSAPAAPQQRVLTPRLRDTARRARFWVIIAVVLLAFGGIAALGSGTASPGTPFSAENPAPAGSRAVAQVLGDAGIEVVLVHSLDEARAAVDDPAATSILVADQGYLDAAQLAEAAGLARSAVVLVSQPLDALGELEPGIEQGALLGRDDDEVDAFEPDCAVPAAQRAGGIRSSGTGLTAERGTACYPGRDGAGLVRIEQDGGTLTLLGASDVLRNDRVDEGGNAALALGLLGEQPRLVWYLPSIDDVEGAATLGELSPPWVVPLSLLAIGTGIAAAIWRGRRFGPLVVEPLPVTVRSGETTEGRARMYARGDAREHALDQLRLGALRRIAKLLGLDRAVGYEAVIDCAAQVTGRPVEQLRRLLVDDQPAGDAQLVEAAQQLQRLEEQVERSLGRP